LGIFPNGTGVNGTLRGPRNAPLFGGKHWMSTPSVTFSGNPPASSRSSPQWM
jgi:hypothetical protein